MTDRPTPAEVIAVELFVTGRTARSRPERILAALADAGYAVVPYGHETLEAFYLSGEVLTLTEQRNRAVRALANTTRLWMYGSSFCPDRLLDEPWVKEITRPTTRPWPPPLGGRPR